METLLDELLLDFPAEGFSIIDPSHPVGGDAIKRFFFEYLFELGDGGSKAVLRDVDIPGLVAFSGFFQGLGGATNLQAVDVLGAVVVGVNRQGDSVFAHQVAAMERFFAGDEIKLQCLIDGVLHITSTWRAVLGDRGECGGLARGKERANTMIKLWALWIHN